MLADMDALRDLDLLQQLDLLRPREDVRRPAAAPESQTTGAETKGKP